MRFSGCNDRRLSGLEGNLVCSLKLEVEVVRGDTWEFLYYERPLFIKKNNVIVFDVS